MMMMRVPLMLALCLVAVAVVTACLQASHVLGEGMIALLLAGASAGVVAAGAPREAPEKRVRAGIDADAEGNAKVFTLSVGQETVVLEPGKPWTRVDYYKWVTRGLIEGPQSYHVLPDGTVEINGERIVLGDPEGVARLEHEINKRHSSAPVRKSPVAEVERGPDLGADRTPCTGKVRFKVKVDHLGHLMIQAARGAEKFETGLRGLPSFVVNGLMIKPGRVHLDPLQRSIEIDDVRCECTAEGACQLEELLNSRYAPVLHGEHEGAIEIKDNPAAPTGFDIRFVTAASGVRVEVKGHLSQEKLDILQDPAHCDLLRHGIVLRLSPPNLIVRRRRPDGGEERIPEFPDVPYRRVTAAQLALIFNNPLLRQTAGKAGAPASLQAGRAPSEIIEMRVRRNPQTHPLLWLECLFPDDDPPLGKAFTHHNLADLQHGGAFLPHLDVSLSLDHRTLSILNQASGQEESITIDAQSSDDDLAKASRLLTVALKPPAVPLVEPSPSTPAPLALPEPTRSEEPALLPAPSPPPQSAPLPASSLPPALPLTPEVASAAPKELEGPAKPHVEEKPEIRVPEPPAASPPRIEADPVEPKAVESPIEVLFRETDPRTICTDIFRALQQRIEVPVQDLLLSLPRVFEDRRFEVLSFQEYEITSVLELRAEDFYGFYLSHVSDRNTLLVYACQGRHIEWSSSRCLLEGSVASEANEFKGGALLGMAQDRENRFVFVVTPQYKEWVKAYERHYLEVSACFRTVRDLAAHPEEYVLIWPENLAEPLTLS